jgi:predicted NBD/HSP70 family sugar kinase
MKYAIGLDVGGTKIEGVLVDENLKEITRCRRLTERKKPREEIIENIISSVQELLKSKKVNAKVGVGFPGYVNKEGKIQLAPNLPQFNNFDLKKHLEKHLGNEIKIENDAHCFVLAEQKLGAAKGAQNVLGVTLGTGVGGGAIINGKIYEGKSGGASHFGHMIIDPSGNKCGCGQRGDFESWCGGRFVAQRYKANGGKIENASTREIFKSPEQAAKIVIKETYEKIGVGLANLVSIFNPEVIVIGGGMSNSLNFPELREITRKYSYKSLFEDVKLVKNELGDSAGVFGAAALTFD